MNDDPDRNSPQRNPSANENSGASGEEREPSVVDEDARQVADLLLAETLLESLSARAADEQSQRIERTVQTLRRLASADRDDRPRPATTPAGRFSRRRSTWAIAALLLVGTLAVWLQFADKSGAVETILREIGAASLDPEYRVYDVVRSEPTTLGGEAIGQLHLRGRDGFVLTCADATLGRSDGEFWLVDRDEVVVASDFGWIVGDSEQQRRELFLLREISAASAKAPLVEMSATVQLLLDHYSLSLHRDQMIDGVPFDLVVGQRREASHEEPEQILLWSDERSRLIARAEFRWGSPDENIVTLQAVDATPRDRDWFRRQRHHAVDHEVRRLSRRAER
ncbi:MAG: hypothetical protein AAF961_08335 [Planctomycetota bacterium]